MANIYGYIRVSTRDQNEDRQMAAFQGLSVPEKNIFMDKQSGKDFIRPSYQKMVRRMKKDDLLYIKSIDRLGRKLIIKRKNCRRESLRKGVLFGKNTFIM